MKFTAIAAALVGAVVAAGLWRQKQERDAPGARRMPEGIKVRDIAGIRLS